MKRCVFTLFFALLSAQLLAQAEWGIGIRAPEPAGITVKKYLNGGGNALEFSIGAYSYAYGYGTAYPGYRGRYRRYNDFYYYRGGGVAIMIDYLWQRPISGVQGLYWYAGPGLQMRSFQYLYRPERNAPWEERAGFGLGPNGMAGLEWFIPQADFFSVFVDMGMYLELAPRPWAGLNAGIGFRFNF